MTATHAARPSLPRRRARAALGLLVPLLLPAAAAAQTNVEDAQALIDLGMVAYDEAEYGEALTIFQASRELDPRPLHLFHIGMCQRALGDMRAARENLQAFLADPVAAAKPDLRAEAEQALADMDTLPCPLTVEVDVDGAMVFVDDLVRGVSPLRWPVQVQPGSRVVRAELEGYVTATETVELRGGEATTVSLGLVPEGGAPDVAVLPPPDVPPPDVPPPDVPPPDVPPPDVPEPSSEGGLGTWFWVSIGAGAATGITAIATGSVSLVERDEYEAAAFRERDAYDRIVALQIATDVMIGLTAAAAVAAVLIGVLGSDDEAEEPVSEAPTVAVGPAGLVLQW